MKTIINQLRGFHLPLIFGINKPLKNCSLSIKSHLQSHFLLENSIFEKKHHEETTYRTFGIQLFWMC